MYLILYLLKLHQFHFFTYQNLINQFLQCQSTKNQLFNQLFNKLNVCCLYNPKIFYFNLFLRQRQIIRSHKSIFLQFFINIFYQKSIQKKYCSNFIQYCTIFVLIQIILIKKQKDISIKQIYNQKRQFFLPKFNLPTLNYNFVTNFNFILNINQFNLIQLPENFSQIQQILKISLKKIKIKIQPYSIYILFNQQKIIFLHLQSLIYQQNNLRNYRVVSINFINLHIYQLNFRKIDLQNLLFKFKKSFHTNTYNKKTEKKHSWYNNIVTQTCNFCESIFFLKQAQKEGKTYDLYFCFHFNYKKQKIYIQIPIFLTYLIHTS
eukprot:TRINITY_DN9814_c0_g1_i3.p1 TRINITY_DN9814_c0_g1~~TRINITY_DN9814_c0_g1_i3.p1  ORF type:complete len:320 (+),score=-33.75 TRINITY_DN9814_c0_g1_i3:581-1540(+)